MGFCKIPMHHKSSYGAHNQRLSCGAVPARSPVTTYPEGGARQLLRHDGPHQLPASNAVRHHLPQQHVSKPQLLSPIVLEGPDGESQLRAPAGPPHVLHRPAVVLEADSLPPPQPAVVLLPPSHAAQLPHGVTVQPCQEPDQELESAAPQGLQTHLPSRSRSGPGHDRYPSRREAYYDAYGSSSSSVQVTTDADGGGFVDAGAATHMDGPPHHLQQLQHHHHQQQQRRGAQHLLHEAHPQFQYGLAEGLDLDPTPQGLGGPAGREEDLPPFLDAASRSGGKVSTSDPQPTEFAPTLPMAGRRHGSGAAGPRKPQNAGRWRRQEAYSSGYGPTAEGDSAGRGAPSARSGGTDSDFRWVGQAEGEAGHPPSTASSSGRYGGAGNSDHTGSSHSSISGLSNSSINGPRLARTAASKGDNRNSSSSSGGGGILGRDSVSDFAGVEAAGTSPHSGQFQADVLSRAGGAAAVLGVAAAGAARSPSPGTAPLRPPQPYDPDGWQEPLRARDDPSRWDESDGEEDEWEAVEDGEEEKRSGDGRDAVGAADGSQPAARGGRSGRPQPSAKPRVKPREWTPAVHASFREEAKLRWQALLPRQPTDADLILTARVMRAVHWRDVVGLASEHLAEYDRWASEQRAAAVLPAGGMSSGPASGHSEGQSHTHALGFGGHSESSPGCAAAAARGGPVPVSELPFTPQHVAAILSRVVRLLPVSEGPVRRAEALQLHAMVDALARMSQAMLESPGMTMREIVTILYALIRLRRPLRKPFVLNLMNAARKRFTVALPPPPQRGPPRRSGPRSKTKRKLAKGGQHGHPGDPSGGVAAGQATTALPYNGQDLSLLLWCISRSGQKGLRSDWSAAYCTALMRVVPELSGQGIGLVMYGATRLQWQPPADLLTALCDRMVELMAAAGSDTVVVAERADCGSGAGGAHPVPSGTSRGASSGDLAAAAAAPASGEMERVHPGALRPIRGQGGRGQDRLHSSDPRIREACTCPVNSSTGDGPMSAARSPAAPSSLPLRRRCLPADISQTLWSFAKRHLPPCPFCPEFLPAVVRYSQQRLADFPEQELSCLVWAMARLQYTPPPAWFSQLYDVVHAQLPYVGPQALPTLLYSLACLQQRPAQAWLGAVAERARELLPYFTPQALALTVLALALMGCRLQHSWLADFHSELESRPGQMDIRHRDKVREAYRLLGFRPGTAPPGPALRPLRSAAAGPAGAAGGLGSFSYGASPGAARRADPSGTPDALGTSARRGEALGPGSSRWQAVERRGGEQQQEEQEEDEGASAEAAGAEVGHAERESLRRKPQSRSRDGEGARSKGQPAAVGTGSGEDAETLVLVRPSRFA